MMMDDRLSDFELPLSLEDTTLLYSLHCNYERQSTELHCSLMYYDYEYRYAYRNQRKMREAQRWGPSP